VHIDVSDISDRQAWTLSGYWQGVPPGKGFVVPHRRSQSLATLLKLKDTHRLSIGFPARRWCEVEVEGVRV
jgi:hypothetical protein